MRSLVRSRTLLIYEGTRFRNRVPYIFMKVRDFRIAYLTYLMKVRDSKIANYKTINVRDQAYNKDVI